MKLLSFKGNSAGLFSIADKLVRFRLNGDYSHVEIMFEPGDDVDIYMPDGTTQPNEDGYWCCSSVPNERMPKNSTRRPGEMGGVRFARILPEHKDWNITNLSCDPKVAALWGIEHNGMKYDWNLILGYIAWIMPDKSNRFICSEACAAMMGMEQAWRFDPCSITVVADELFREVKAVKRKKKIF